MPIVNWDQEITFNHPDVYGNSGGYNRQNREYLIDVCSHRSLVNLFPYQQGESILLVGAGFGWIAELFIENGLAPVCAVDTSLWIQQEKQNHSVIDVHNLDVTNVNDQQSIKQILGLQPNEKIDWCITEDFFTGISDEECLAIAESLRGIGNNVIHYITPPPVKDLEILRTRNWKTGPEWKQLLSPDSILMVHSGNIL